MSKVRNKDVYERIAFLKAASEAAAENDNLWFLSQYLGREGDLTKKKSLLRTKPGSMECKNCRAPIIPGKTAKVTVTSSHIRTECLLCGFTRTKPVSYEPND